jgi:hypothetical protein
MSDRAEVLTISELFRGRFFKTSTKHSGWRWSDTHVSQLLSDLDGLKSGESLHLGTVLHQPHPQQSIEFGGLRLTPHTLFDGYHRIATMRGLALATAEALGEVESPMARMQANSLRRQYGLVDGHQRLTDPKPNLPSFALPFTVTGEDAHERLDTFISELSRKVTVLFYTTQSEAQAHTFIERQADRGSPRR